MSATVKVYPPMVAACDELRKLDVFEVEGNNGAVLYRSGDPHISRHLDLDAERLGEFMALLPFGGRGQRVLDLGANPYILSYALLRADAKVVAGGHPRPKAKNTAVAPEERVEFRDLDRLIASLPLVRFDVEADTFPFPDGAFDAVICGELIEHLIVGPDRMMKECNRVLTPNGRLLLSTPNSVSLARIIGMIRGASLDWPYSDQGIHNRHNRLYTMRELHDLMVGNGFRPLLEKGMTFPHRREWYPRGVLGATKHALIAGSHAMLQWQAVRLRRLAEGLLVAAEKVEGPRLYRPAWLFGGADSVPMVAGLQPLQVLTPSRRRQGNVRLPRPT